MIMAFHIKKGYDVPISGTPEQQIQEAPRVSTVALVGADYVGMKPTMLVKEGEVVQKGQAVFECKKCLGVIYTAPAAGVVKSIVRGDRRVFQNLVIEVAENEDHVTFENFINKTHNEYSKEEVTALLVESGLWTGLRTRPFSKVPSVGTEATAIFINAMDTNPLSTDPAVVIKEHQDAFKRGTQVLSKLTAGKTYVVRALGSQVPVADGDNIELAEFHGVHPAGNVGTHIHFLNPVYGDKKVWHIGYQDVIAIGRLFSSGLLFTDRIVALGGPKARNPRLLRTRLGADISQLIAGEVKEGPIRTISGSILNGRKVDETFHYLGRYHNQITVLEEDTHREFLGWQGPGWDKISLKDVFASHVLIELCDKIPFLTKKVWDLGTNKHGSPRAMVPVGVFEQVMPLDILPTQLLRALVCGDSDHAQLLGCLELDEEDLALCTYASPGKTDFGPLLRDNLTIIEKEG